MSSWQCKAPAWYVWRCSLALLCQIHRAVATTTAIDIFLCSMSSIHQHTYIFMCGQQQKQCWNLFSECFRWSVHIFFVIFAKNRWCATENEKKKMYPSERQRQSSFFACIHWDFFHIFLFSYSSRTEPTPFFFYIFFFTLCVSSIFKLYVYAMHIIVCEGDSHFIFFGLTVLCYGITAWNVL